MAKATKKTRKVRKVVEEGAPVPFSHLSKKELKHLRESGVRTLTEFKKVAAAQKEMRDRGEHEPCYECKFIAKKLGLAV